MVDRPPPLPMGLADPANRALRRLPNPDYCMIVGALPFGARRPGQPRFAPVA